MLKNRPLEIPKIQFCKLIRYWSLPEIMAMSDKNTENRSKQTCPHWTGSTNFGLVRKQLDEIQHRIEAGEDDEMHSYRCWGRTNLVDFVATGEGLQKALSKKIRRFVKCKLNMIRKSYHYRIKCIVCRVY
ncbi:hypothetical protein PIB30_092261 [Stylosanthes scabra]|uniref:Uncharacterized protein n=1 Tax=Stylosanthes scabra TaxID=79078 RepID=A0ABU6RV30_9FABA|nr:hypothetical protein [Stylosanthes scabra]